MSAAQPATTGVRLDVWLWAARFFKTRALAKAAVTGGRIQCNGQPTDKPARMVHPGDALRVVRGEERLEISVLALSGTRGPASVAQALYAESAEARARREAERAMRSAERAGFQAPEKRPDKRARRLIRALGDIDAF